MVLLQSQPPRGPAQLADRAVELLAGAPGQRVDRDRRSGLEAGGHPAQAFERARVQPGEGDVVRRPDQRRRLACRPAEVRCFIDLEHFPIIPGHSLS